MAETGAPVLGSLYVYAPNKVAPIVFAIAYGASAVGHIYQVVHHKSFSLIGLQPVCAVLFTIGYVLREFGAFHYIYNNKNLILYILSQVCIFVCPPLLELSNYHVLGRMLYYVPFQAPIPPGQVLAIFGGVMALVELSNALGVAFSSNITSAQTEQDLGRDFTLAALALQLAAIMSFVTITGIFHQRCQKARICSRGVYVQLRVMYVSMGLIWLRTIYRLVEYSGNTAKDIDNLADLQALSPVVRYEWYFLVFDSTLMLTNSALWNIWNPSRYLSSDYRIHLAADGVTEVQREGVKDDRSLPAKLANILTFGVLFRKNRSTLPYHELCDYPRSDLKASKGSRGMTAA